MFCRAIHKKLCLSSLLLAFTSPFVMAEQGSQVQAQANMQVTLEVLKSCSFTADKMDFGQHKSDEGKDIETSSNLNVVCTKNTPYSITTANSDLSMQPTKGDGEKVNFALYSDKNNSTPLNNTTALSGTGTGAVQTLTIWGKVPATELAKASAGKYQANVTLNMMY
ncbi:spore coat U domain-containing protein [Escherichia coli]|uniref:Csu type fimbrial protein n=1 Tax=Enterobacteriaceae TaxID=543 RepID=UPI000DD62F3A|nr:spore coat U domain-containing protein [Escherichia coli]EIH0678016.1 spore coat protein U domain-containing protein [Escherichia coli O148]EFB5232197.1 spore coat protein U domain-containing protein [Escherichia coli]EFN8009449.1 SCPU domain-containing protein [Escherichia coli]EKT1600759.1 spore coat protein U domain-containing protein [Escherichia coli]ELW1124273.1 spore coat protein U domain-containing protein [Escherichia coli]